MPGGRRTFNCATPSSNGGMKSLCNRESTSTVKPTRAMPPMSSVFENRTLVTIVLDATALTARRTRASLSRCTAGALPNRSDERTGVTVNETTREARIETM